MTDVRPPSVLSLSTNSMDEGASLLGAYFLCVSGCMFLLADRLKAKPHMLKNWLNSQTLAAFNGNAQNQERLIKYLTVACMFYFCLPLLTLVGWTVLIVFDNIKENRSQVSAASVLLIGLAILSAGTGLVRWKWRGYRLDKYSFCLMLAGVVLVTVYQGLVIFWNEHGDKFFPVSALFLNFNVLVLIALLYFSQQKKNMQLRDFIKRAFPELGVELDPDREADLNEEINEQAQDANWKVSSEDLCDIITVGMVDKDQVFQALGGGFQSKFNSRSAAFRLGAKIGMLVLALLILAVYSFIVYLEDENKLGLITSVSVVLMDLFNYLLLKTELIETPGSLLFLLIMNRALMVAFGEGYWLYGYMVLYVVYSFAFMLTIAKNRFPFEGEIVRQYEVDDLKKLTAAPAGEAAGQVTQQVLAAARYPEIQMGILTLLYVVIIAVIKFVKIDGVELKAYKIYEKEVSWIALAVLSLALALSFYFFAALFRIFVRKANRLEIYDSKRVKEQGNSCCSLWQRYLAICYVICVIWSIAAFYVTESVGVLLTGLLGTLSALSFAQAYLFFILNEFDYTQDIGKLNLRIDRHNRKIGEMEFKKKDIQTKLQSGEITLVPAANQQEQEEVAQNEANAEAEAEATAAQAQAVAEAQARAVQELIQKEEEKKRREAEEREKQLQENAELRRKEEENYQRMQEQIQREKEQAEQRRIEAEQKRKKQLEERAAKQRAEDERRRLLDQQKKKQIEAAPAANAYNFTGQIQQGQIVQNNEAYADDEMYEGGDETQNSQKPFAGGNDSQLQIDPSHIYINMDVYEKKGDFQKIATTRLKRVKDWRVNKDSLLEAYRLKVLRPNDYVFIHSLGVALLALVILSISLSILWSDILGLVIAFPILYLWILILIASTVVYQSRKFRVDELVLWGVLNTLYVVVALLYFAFGVEADLSEIDPTVRNPELVGAANFLLYYLLLPPTLIHAIVPTMRIIDRGLEEFEMVYKVFLGVAATGLVLMIVTCTVLIHWVDGVIYLGVLVAIVYMAAQYWSKSNRDYFQSMRWDTANKILIFLLVMVAIIWSFASEDLNHFEGISYSSMTLVLILWLYALAQFVYDFRDVSQRPLFFSASVFPVYKYNPAIQNVQEHFGPTMAWLAGLALALIWSFLAAYGFAPEWFGAVLTIGVNLLALSSVLHLVTITTSSVVDAIGHIDEATIKKAWIQTKLSYVKEKGAFSRHDLRTFRRLWIQRFYLKNYLSYREDGKADEDLKTVGDVAFAVDAPEGDPLEFYKAKVQQTLPRKYNVEDSEELNAYYLEIEELVREAYIDEMEQIIQFTMICVQVIKSQQNAYRKDFLRFIHAKQDIFHALGIGIQIPSRGSMDQRWKQLQDQIAELNPQERSAFDSLRAVYLKEKQQQKDDSKKVREQGLEKQVERDQKAEELRKQKEDQLAALRQLMEQRQKEAVESQAGDDFDLDMDLDSMPDCRMKYEIIVRRAKKGMGKFTDNQFKADDSAIGDSVKQGLGLDFEWHRLGDDGQQFHGSDYCIFKYGVDVNDIEQGQLGDCYYLSALVVLGSRLTRERFVFIESEDEWRECGAFCVVFYDNGKEDVVIVDDHFPMFQKDFVFVRCQDRTELWPNILEKAYAKKYGSYSSIQGGFADIALAELINGIPEKIRIETQQNQKNLWDYLLNLHKEGTLLGAGSPDHPDGDRAKSDTGIVLGHAFSILKVVEADNHQLIQIRNPWGEGEWKGDWCDDSDLWTQRIKNLTGQQEFKEDGIFWMDFGDFCEEFEEIYICRNYSDPASGWHSILIDDKWEGKYAEGLPTRENRNAQMEKNPQFGVTVHQPGKGFVVMRMKEKDNHYTAKQHAYLNMQHNSNGKLISEQRRKQQLCSMGPRNHPLQSKEIAFPDDLSYPYTFSVLVANMKNGQEGFGNFSVQVFSRDPKMKAAKLN